MRKSELEKLRKEIDNIDSEIVKLFVKRFKIVKQIGDYKKNNNLPVVDNNRFAKVLEKVNDIAAKNGISSNFINKIYNLIHEYSCELEK